MKGTSKPEVYILLQMGIKPSDIIRLGYSYSTVYNYNIRYQRAKRKVDELLKKLMVK